MARWKAYWIMRGVERYLFKIQDAAALAIVSPLIDQFEKAQACTDCSEEPCRCADWIKQDDEYKARTVLTA